MKPGIKTSEFWLTLVMHIVAIVTLIASAFGGDEVLAVTAIIAEVLGQLGYTASRTKAKTGETSSGTDTASG